MKKEDLLIMGAAAVAVFLFYGFLERKRGGTGTAATVAGDFATKITEWAGWQYFTDGTVIGPDGSYYSNGVKVWSPS